MAEAPAPVASPVASAITAARRNATDDQRSGLRECFFVEHDQDDEDLVSESRLTAEEKEEHTELAAGLLGVVLSVKMDAAPPVRGARARRAGRHRTG
ncbi:hypothetical protein ACH45E_14440 [Streptomyces sp. NPDC020299]|uniref:hypothetical protein n=1 Tax=Streptomyces sp. NPDC020299 TaxID=3365067 RepID=UPI0037B0CE91